MQSNYLPPYDIYYLRAKTMGDIIDLINIAYVVGQPYRTPEYYAAVHAFEHVWNNLNSPYEDDEVIDLNSVTYDDIKHLFAEVFIFSTRYNEDIAMVILSENFTYWQGLKLAEENKTQQIQVDYWLEFVNVDEITSFIIDRNQWEAMSKQECDKLMDEKYKELIKGKIMGNRRLRNI
ncbi:hypothetical protein [Entomomonas asaccharolytica]|uniref:Uncharacterized protein n=1 Tax=Entomomonas asaccharolytica TaxID=2785331 RepID=A0A974RWB5_9GAMM|nr:hypothetical protein [Entomomonas asaccharolytica]QQP85023.1 hypothetical protein JHT90_11585 [Entomomonas asaccharolytica]